MTTELKQVTPQPRPFSQKITNIEGVGNTTSSLSRPLLRGYAHSFIFLMGKGEMLALSGAKCGGSRTGPNPRLLPRGEVTRWPAQRPRLWLGHASNTPLCALPARPAAAAPLLPAPHTPMMQAPEQLRRRMKSRLWQRTGSSVRKPGHR